TQLYGPPGAGKTNLALNAAVATVAEGGRALYIDTEGLSFDRFEQLARTFSPEGTVEPLASRFVVSAVHDFDEQEVAVREAIDVADESDLIVLDSATGFYRLERVDEPEEAAGDALRRLADQIAHLLGLARRFDLAVVITNQVFTDPEEDALRPLGGHTLQHWSGTILRMDRFRAGNRRVVLEKHRSRSVGSSTRVQITDRGITDGETTQP
ncbi:MAG: DNA repair and recombination protein RadB, partial [Halobacteriota archaeon]